MRLRKEKVETMEKAIVNVILESYTMNRKEIDAVNTKMIVETIAFLSNLLALRQ